MPTRCGAIPGSPVTSGQQNPTPATWPGRQSPRHRSALDSARRVLLWLALVSLLIAVPDMVVQGRTRLIIGTVGALLIAASWVVGYRRRAVPVLLDLVDAAALAMIGLGAPSPWGVASVAFGGLWLRSFYGGGHRVAIRVALYALAGLAATALTPGAPGLIAAAAGVPLMTATGVAGWRLAVILRRHDVLSRLSAVRADLGSALVGQTDIRIIGTQAQDAWRELCEQAPGLRVLIAEVRDGRILVHASFGAWAEAPTELSARTLDQIAPLVGLAEARLGGAPTLDAAAGAPTRWALGTRGAEPSDGREWVLVLGAAPELADEVVAAAVAAVAQVELAIDSAAAHRALAARAGSDELTGLANRATFFAGLERVQEAGVTTSVVYLDLDGFKAVNDTHGHLVGDEVLRQVAARLRSARRERDLCARLGGDEFAVMLPRTDRAAAEAIGRRLEALVSAPITTSAGMVMVGASWGVGTSDRETGPDQELVGRADAAMYAVKRARRATDHHTLLPRVRNEPSIPDERGTARTDPHASDPHASDPRVAPGPAGA